MKIQQVQYFLKVAETGNQTVAARALFISQSPLFRKILALKSDLGAPPMDSCIRRITLTRAGEVFRDHALHLNDDYLAMMPDLNEFKMAPSCSILAIPIISRYGNSYRQILQHAASL
ncbi:MAG: LysR family transcriptional regulator [Caldilineaceae bacterium]